MKIDLHCHSYYSDDGLSSPRDLIKEALKKGLDGIALTDHETTKGWEEAKKAAKELGAFLILGEEIKVEKNRKKVGDILAFFIKEKIKSREIFLAIKEIKDQGGLVFVAHPFHFREKFRDNLEEYLGLIDGIEVFNGRSFTNGANEKALFFAKKYNLPMIGGSDAHFKGAVGSVFTEAEAKNLEEFKRAILERKTEIARKTSSFIYLFAPFLGKIKHLPSKIKKA
ncbi:MAG: PHP-associated domain-containing protein [Candidatus Aenigmatarchaeota archaeon]